MKLHLLAGTVAAVALLAMQGVLSTAEAAPCGFILTLGHPGIQLHNHRRNYNQDLFELFVHQPDRINGQPVYCASRSEPSCQQRRADVHHGRSDRPSDLGCGH